MKRHSPTPEGPIEDSSVDTTEQRLQLALEGAALATWDWNITTGQTFYNARWGEMLGYELHEIGTDLGAWSEMVHPDDYPRVWQLLSEHLEGSTPIYQAEYRLRDRNGRWIWVLSHGRVYQRGADGMPLRAAGVHQDVTQRKEAEEALLLSREMYKNTVELTTQIPWTATPDGAISTCDPVWESFTGLPLEDALSSRWLESVHPDDRQRMYAAWVHSVATGEPYRVAHRLRRADSEYRNVESRAQAQRDAGGRILRWYGTTEDIHDRTVAEQKLRASEERGALALEGAQLATWDWNLRTGEVIRSPRWFEMLGYPEAEATLQPEFWTEKLHPDDVAQVRAALDAHWKGETPVYRMEFRIRHKSGEWRWILSHGRVVERDQHGPVRACGVNQDITEHRRAGEALANSEHFSRLLLEASQDCVLLLDEAGCIIYTNPAGSRRFPDGGKRQLWTDLWGPENERTIVAAMRTAFAGKPASFEALCGLTPPGWWNVLLSPLPRNPGQPKRILAVARETTELKKQEERRRVSFERERLQAILENLNEGIIIAEPDGTVLLMNRSAQEMYGFHTANGGNVQCEDLLKAIEAGDSPDHIFPSTERPLSRALRGERFSGMETFFRNRQTGQRWIGSCGSTPVHSPSGDLLLAVLSVRDVTAECKTADEIRNTNHVLHELSGQLLRLQDDERKQIARELHDGTVQLLSAALMNLTVLADSPAVRDAEFENRLLSKTLHLTQQAVKELRSMSYLLHPPVLDELGLVPALRSWIDGFSERTGIPVDIDISGDLGRLGAPVETALFRIMQEALGNVHRHANGSTAGVRLIVAGDIIRLEIIDDGKGFEWAGPAASGANRKFGVGLLGMRERASQLGGSMSVDSRPGKTVICIELPGIVSGG